MRYVAHKTLLSQIFTTTEGKTDKKRLFKGHKKVANKLPADRKVYIDDNGPGKWSPVKDKLTSIFGDKCWYTEIESNAGPLAIDHYRPSCDYWWLALDAENYRVACPYANSPKWNEEHGASGGKGDSFPLLPPNLRAKGKNQLRQEKPVILDPCSIEDCNHIAFDPDGRPVLSPAFKNNGIALHRLNESKLLLNLDLPRFNILRGKIYTAIVGDIKDYEVPNQAEATKHRICLRMEERISAKAQFSMAARCYLEMFKDHGWVDQILRQNPYP